MTFVYRPIHWVRNSFQYLLGAIFCILLFGSISAFNLIFGLVSFLITYNSVYFINDIIDYSEDKNKETKYVKPMVSNIITLKEAKFYAFVSMVIGISLSLLLNRFFTILLISLILLNILHSFLRKRTNLKLPNFLLVQFIKCSLGWFALTLTLNNFPFWPIITLASASTFNYFLYKNDLQIRDILRTKKITFITLLLLCLTSYIASIFLFPFKLPLILILFILPVFALCSFKFDNIFKRIMVGDIFSHLSMLIFIVLFLLLINPAIAALNEKISKPLDDVMNNMTKITPTAVAESASNLEINLTYKLESAITKISNISVPFYKG